jgi:hypothetical protein
VLSSCEGRPGLRRVAAGRRLWQEIPDDRLRSLGAEDRELRSQRRPDGRDRSADLEAARLRLSTDPAVLREADFVIVAVPTPVDDAHIPDFTPLIGASTMIGPHLKPGAVVVYESTVYPGRDRGDLHPELEKHSGLKWKKDFFVGYSPERINPGDREHTLTNASSRWCRATLPGDAGTRRLACTAHHRAGVHRAQHQGGRGRPR